MRTESLREVKNNLSRVIEGLGESGPVLLTKNGRTRASGSCSTGLHGDASGPSSASCLTERHSAAAMAWAISVVVALPPMS